MRYTYVQTWPRPADPAVFSSDRLERDSDAAEQAKRDSEAAQCAADRRRPFFSGYDPGGAAALATSFLDHIRDFVSSVFGKTFGARRRDRRPGAWHLVSDAHIDALTDVMNDLHAGLSANLVVGATPPLRAPLSSWETMRPGRHLDDICVDHIAACVAAAAGSSIFGGQQGPDNVSESAKIDAFRASGYLILGVLDTQCLRYLDYSNTTSAARRGRDAAGGSPGKRPR